MLYKKNVMKHNNNQSYMVNNLVELLFLLYNHVCEVSAARLVAQVPRCLVTNTTFT